MSFRSERIKARKRVAEVAEHLGVNAVSVYLWETGKNMPRADRLKRLAEYYGCTADALMAEDEEEKEAV